MTSPSHRVTMQNWQDAQTIWDYHQVGHEVTSCDAAIGLGSHDLGVAAYAAELYHTGLFSVLVFSGANSPTTAKRFPRGEAVHYREHAIELGVPDSAILVESQANNTGQNISLSRVLLAEHGHTPRSLLLISKPYMERRAFATCRKVWLVRVAAHRPTRRATELTTRSSFNRTSVTQDQADAGLEDDLAVCAVG